MGLVEYSDSESDSEQAPPPSKTITTTSSSSAPSAKKPFQKLLDRSSGTSKIVVNLTSAGASSTDPDDQPPAKRAKTAATGASRFSNLGSFLPPPKKPATAAPNAPTTSESSARKSGRAPAPGVHLRTGAEPAFVRGGDISYDDDNDNENANITAPSTLGLPPPRAKSPPGPSIPEGSKPESQVKLVGKPLMFLPLSVARKKKAGAASSKKKDISPAPPAQTKTNTPPQAPTSDVVPPPVSSSPPLKRKKVSLFAVADDESTTPSSAPRPSSSTATETYEPLFYSTTTDPTLQTTTDLETDVTSEYPTYNPPAPSSTTSQQNPQSLADLADTLALSASARRDLFGRNGGSSVAAAPGMIPPGAKVVTFDMEREYAHNQALRASGEQQVYNPVRAIAPGKHSLRQIVNMAQSNQGALEESFAAGKNKAREAAGRYGWK